MKIQHIFLEMFAFIYLFTVILYKMLLFIITISINEMQLNDNVFTLH